MLDPKRLREEFESIQTALEHRGIPEGFERYIELDKRRRLLQTEFEEIRAKKNKVGPEIAKAKKAGEDAESLLKEMQQLGAREKELAGQVEALEQETSYLELRVPNVPHESVPKGKDDSSNRIEKEWGEKKTFSFTAKTHWDLGEALGILDFKRAAELSGARFSLLKGMGARLERALINFMLETQAAAGYQEVLPPYLAREKTVLGSGQLPKFEADLFKTDDSGSRLFLLPTAEVALCNLHADEIIDSAELPLNYTAYTPCFRSEAGSYGRDVRGLIRLHQFNKVELVKLCAAETSYEELEKLTADAERILELLKLPYRRVTLCSGDMGFAASKTYDLEVWLPGMGEYREISSCSNTEDFQARRNKTRYREGAKGKPQFVHMLNGSGLAVGRTMVAVLENYQQEDGSILVPEVLRPYIGGVEVIK